MYIYIYIYIYRAEVPHGIKMNMAKLWEFMALLQKETFVLTPSGSR